MPDQSRLIFRRNPLSANIVAPARSLLYLCRQRIIWKPVLDWNSINLCYNKGQRLGVSSTQPRLKALIDVSLHSTSAWKEGPSEIARSLNPFLCNKLSKKYLRYRELVFSDQYKVALLSADRFWEEGALWLADELEKVCELKDELYLITASI